MSQASDLCVAVHALRTTTVRQTRGVVRVVESDGAVSMCAVGVIADAFGQEWRGRGLRVGDRHMWATSDINWSIRVRIAALVGTKTTLSPITERNDSDGLTLAQIADWLEAVNGGGVDRELADLIDAELVAT